MTDRPETQADDGNEPTLSVDIHDDAELWLGVEEKEGFAPTVIVGGNAHGLRMLAALCTALADTAQPGGQVSLVAGDLLLEGSQADLVLARRPRSGRRPGRRQGRECGAGVPALERDGDGALAFEREVHRAGVVAQPVGGRVRRGTFEAHDRRAALALEAVVATIRER